ncbi:hypothetical protein CAOG_009099 [Capsaspora owczarzaki ATCC 30864]|uniref:Uncharacterized protein n=2 Tax=Capsaspora owczarzaki (strain ATCC 30864) TaxID=595528 RepID=A0A0D2X507_CAPO3|nr:hypothetical protein CAOG_009099 [Capsaspora owczarzaki ATCC 30864]
MPIEQQSVQAAHSMLHERFSAAKAHLEGENAAIRAKDSNLPVKERIISAGEAVSQKVEEVGNKVSASLHNAAVVGDIEAGTVEGAKPGSYEAQEAKREAEHRVDTVVERAFEIKRDTGFNRT